MSKRKASDSQSERFFNTSCAESAVTLPSDVWQLIFDLFAPWPRLNVASVVCKQWRIAALRTFKTLRFYHGWHVPCRPRIAALFTSLTSARLVPPYLGSLPPAIRELNLELDLTTDFTHFSRLTMLIANKSLVCTVDDSVEGMNAFCKLALMSSYIGKLHISLIEDANILASVNLPRLTSLSVLNYEHTEAVCHRQFILRHLPRLSKLTLRIADSDPFLDELIRKLAAYPTLKLFLLGDSFFEERTCIVRNLVNDFPAPCFAWNAVRSFSLHDIRKAPDWSSLADASYPSLTQCQLYEVFQLCADFVIAIRLLLSAAPQLQCINATLPHIASQAQMDLVVDLLRFSEQCGTRFFRLSYWLVDHKELHAVASQPYREATKALVQGKADLPPNITNPGVVWYPKLQALVQSFKWMRLVVQEHVYDDIVQF